MPLIEYRLIITEYTFFVLEVFLTHATLQRGTYNCDYHCDQGKCNAIKEKIHCWVSMGDIHANYCASFVVFNNYASRELLPQNDCRCWKVTNADWNVICLYRFCTDNEFRDRYFWRDLRWNWITYLVELYYIFFIFTVKQFCFWF